jgi:hypothetical protein
MSRVGEFFDKFVNTFHQFDCSFQQNLFDFEWTVLLSSASLSSFLLIPS